MEYQCTRCNYKFISRRNGKNMPAPRYCPHCKSDLWNEKRRYDTWATEREKEMRKFLARDKEIRLIEIQQKISIYAVMTFGKFPISKSDYFLIFYRPAFTDKKADLLLRGDSDIGSWYAIYRSSYYGTQIDQWHGI